MNNILNYQITQKLYQGSDVIIYQAHRDKDKNPLILKVLHEHALTPERVAQFKREYKIVCDINCMGVIKAYSLEHHQPHWLMVLEDFGGQSLAMLQLANKLDITRFLRLALKIVDIVGEVHQHQVIHQDINPSNILLNPTTQEVKLIDFGISTVLTREVTSFCLPSGLQGTLAYISPEQTGRMNRAIDYRTDYYSLGVTFYELLTGQLPFQSEDSLELVHSHIARQPLPPHHLKPTIPPILSDIILKLMAKNAEDRYQSAHGLKHDLLKCLHQLELGTTIEQFSLGQQDDSDVFQIPQRLYGREVQINTLLDIFENIAKNNQRSQLALVSGHSGIGKTVLVQETYKSITAHHGYFIQGKFDQFQRDVPYAAFIQAFNTLIQQLLTEDVSVIATWRDKILQALGVNGQVLIEVIPEIELIIGVQPPVAKLDAMANRTRFNMVFQNFVKLFAQHEHPLVIFLDDLQWAGTNSRELIKLLLTDPDSKYLLIIGAYRDNVVTETHPLMLMVKDLKEAAVTVNDIFITPLSLANTQDFIAETLHTTPQAVAELAQLAHNKTFGNPFFLSEFLKTLYVEQLINFNYQTSAWQWDLVQINQHTMTDNVVELIADKVKKLSPDIQNVLKLAACIGNQFDFKTLLTISGEAQSASELAQTLLQAIKADIIIPLGNNYKLLENAAVELLNTIQVTYKFAHDRIQQAVYFLIPDTEKQAIHWHIGQVLLQDVARKDELFFDIINHLNQGRELIQTLADYDSLIELNLQAAQKAKTSTAYEMAFNYLQINLELLALTTQLTGLTSWERCYNLTLAIHVEAAELAYFNNNVTAMEALTEQVLQQAKTLLDKIAAYDVRVMAATGHNKLLESIDIALSVLALLGLDFPKEPTQADVFQALKESQIALGQKPIEELIDLPLMSDPYQLAVMSIISNIGSTTYVANPQLFILLVCKQVSLSVQYGNTPNSPFGYALYGLILSGLVGNIEAGYRFGRLAYALMSRLEDKRAESRTLFTAAFFVDHWKTHVQETLPILLRGYQSGLEMGDINFLAISLYGYCNNAFFVGRTLPELAHEMTHYQKVIRQFKQDVIIGRVNLYRQVVANLLQPVEAPYRLVGDIYNEDEMIKLHLATNDISLVNNLYVIKLFLAYLFNDYTQAVEYIESVEKYSRSAIGRLTVVISNFYTSLTYLAIYPSQSEAEQSKLLEKVLANQQKLKGWADHAPMNYLHKFYLVEAEIARVQKRDGEAREYYDQAITLAKENHYLVELAIAKELAGRFYWAKKLTDIAEFYLLKAYYSYRQWGSLTKSRQLEQQYSFLTRELSPTHQPTTTQKTVISTQGSQIPRELDVRTIFKAAQAMSSEIVLDNLLANMIKIAIENAGAERGVLILPREGQWFIEAEYIVNQAKITTLQSILIEALTPDSVHSLVSLGIINYVIRLRKSVILSNASQEGTFQQDKYIRQMKSKSVLCMPLINQGKLSGLLYLEHNSLAGVFTKDRLAVLELLSSQAAISIENARLLAERQQTIQKLEELDRAKSQFLTVMSHELRTPLNAILGFAELLLYGVYGDLPELAVHDIQLMFNSGQHLLTLINDVLDLSKIEAGMIELVQETVDAPHLVSEVISAMNAVSQNKALTIGADIAENLPYIYADRTRLKQILLNLVDNGIKFTRQGFVTVRVMVDPADAQRVLFAVIDTGIGIEEDKQEVIFEAFSQADMSQTRHHEGVGLGLAICKRLTEMHGSKIGLRSQVGVGSEFYFSVPISTEVDL